jgi:hypothetical protein
MPSMLLLVPVLHLLLITNFAAGPGSRTKAKTNAKAQNPY